MNSSAFKLCSVFLLINFFVGCKSDNKKEVNNKVIIAKQSTLHNNCDSINNITLIMYDTHDLFPNEDCTINIAKDNSYIKYNNYVASYLSRNSMTDSIKINKNDEKYINLFFTTKVCNLKNYWDSIYDGGRVRRIYFLKNDKAIVKQVNIIGEPKKIDSLKLSCDFLFEKIIKISNKPHPKS